MKEGVRLPICPKCTSQLNIFSNRIYECPNCDFMMRIDLFQSKFEKSQVPWYKKIYNDDSLWFKDAFDKYPSIISHEYYRLYDMFNEGHTYGAILQIKDLLEVLIKFPTLIAMSNIYDRNDKSIEEMKLIQESFHKILNLGDWRNITNIICKKKMVNDSILNTIIRNIRNIYFKENAGRSKFDIVKWRNETIGHGALKLDSDIGFQNEIVELLKIIKNHFEECYQQYLKLRFYIKTKETIIELKGRNLDKEIIKDGILFIDDGNIDQKLYPYILIDNGGIYFFDAFIDKKHKLSILDYPNGEKKDIVNQSMVEHYHKLYKKSVEVLKIAFSSEIIENNCENLEESYLAESENILNDIQRINDYINPQHIEKWIRKKLLDCNKGIFLLQMERGMGKTVFSKALDENSYNIIQIDDVVTRSYYINDSYLSEYGYFYTALSDLFRTNNEGKIIIKEKNLKLLSGEPSNMKKDFIELLSGYRKKHEKYFGKGKLLLVIDGIDEMPNKENNSIMKLMPQNEELEDGVYILLTCRTEEELSPHILHSVKELGIPMENQIIYNRFNSEYVYVLKEYITQEFKNIEEADIKVVLDKSENRFLYLSILKSIIQNSGIELIHQLPNGEKLFGSYLDMLKLNFGSKYFKGIQRILGILALVEDPVTLNEIVYLYGDDSITFKFLSYLYQIQGLLKSERSYRGNLLSISHIELKDIILKNYHNIVRQLVSDWVYKVSNYKSDKNTMINDGEMYLISNILSYMDKDLEVDFSTLINENFSNALISEGEKLLHNNFEEHNRRRYFKIYSELVKIQKLSIGTVDDYKKLFFESMGNSKLGDALFENLESNYEAAIEKYNLAINCIIQIIELYSNTHFEDFFKTDSKKEDFSEIEIQLIKMIADNYVDIGRVYYRIGEYKNAEEYENKGIEIYEKYIDNENDDDKGVLSLCLIEIARVYCYTERCDQALLNATRALNIQQHLLQQDEETQSIIARTEECIGNIYFKMGDVDRALEILKNTLTRLENLSGNIDIKNRSFKIKICYDIGHIYSSERDFNRSIPYFSKGIRIFNNHEKSGYICEKQYVLENYKGLGYAYLDSKMYNDGIYNFRKAIDILENDIIIAKPNMPSYFIFKGDLHLGIADCYYCAKNYKECLKYYCEYFSLVLEKYPKDIKMDGHDLHISLKRMVYSYSQINNLNQLRIQHEKLKRLEDTFYRQKLSYSIKEIEDVFNGVENQEIFNVMKKNNTNFSYGYFSVNISDHAVTKCIRAVKPLECHYSIKKKTYTIKFDFKKCENCDVNDCPSKKKNGVVKFSEKIWSMHNASEI